MKKAILAVLITGLVVTLGILGYEWFIATSKEKEVTIEKDDTKSLAVKINFDAGDLDIQGGSENWLDAIFEFKNKSAIPKVKYVKKQDKSVLTVKPKSKLFGMNRTNQLNHWDIQLTNTIPIELDVDMGVSKATLNLKGIQLNKLTIDGGVSDSTIDLGGELQNSFQGKIDIGVGRMTLLLPKQTGIKLSIDKGLGKLDLQDFIAQGNNVYINEAYDNSETSIELDVDIGVGSLKVDLVE
ncbi:hypothetical protein DVB69_00055 [Sporosarcina sp. BI001-red]|uniref:toast rack family protein n=1 Tax=Sporosarcina sp. BI001-red TaxID=2282866 RepID=UPI000E23342A|nr:toast rack family protein [Sporosarcina sp. BI001-red]REB11574.1 hypothetical protein DVB69_00055 [Sporosarcina sp. BI001-red]